MDSYQRLNSEKILDLLIGSVNQEMNELRAESAQEGQLFYENCLTEGTVWKRYYPTTRFDNNKDLISIPETRSIIDRISGSLRDYVTIQSQDINNVNLLYDKYKINTLMKSIIKNTLITGNISLWLYKKIDDSVSIEQWKSWFISKKFDNKNNEIGYIKNYVIDNGTIIPSETQPLTKSYDEIIEYVDSDIWQIYKNGTQTYSEPHGLPFIPVVWFESVDMDEDGRYGIPYFMRFKHLLIALNQLASNAHKQTLATPTIWTTTKDFNDSNNILKINPDYINYVGSDKELSQTIRNLNLTEEKDLIKYYTDKIYSASQLPPKDLLENIGQVPSGIALQILYQQLIELLSELTDIFSEKEEDLIKKLYYFEYGKELKDLSIEYINTEIPGERQERFNRDKELLSLGVMTLDEFKEIWR